MCHVLIIEDDWLIADHIAQLLEGAGALSADMAASEQEAVDRAVAHPPAVIISDISLIEGTGPDAVKRIIEAIGRTPVVYVTGEPASSLPIGSGIKVVNKPFEDGVLVATFLSVAPLS